MVGLPHMSKAPSSRSSFSGKGVALSWLLAASGFLSSNNAHVQASPLNSQPFRRADDTVTYPGEHISWAPCGNVTGHLMECSTIDVPMDQFNKANSGNQTFSIPLLRLRGKNTTKDSKNILHNPGGPGASGILVVRSQADRLMGIIGEDFNLVSFDPRGVGASTPGGSCYANNAIRNFLSGIPLDNLVADAPAISSWASIFVKSCADTSGEHGKYINTPQVAADMNSIIDAIGQDRMYFWGQSYGTVIGQTYAGLFPERVERIVIDGIVDNFEWYESPMQWIAYKDTKRAFWGFLDECIKAGEAACPLAALSKNPDELNKLVEEFGTRLKAEPMTVYYNNKNFGIVQYISIFCNGILNALYSHKSWQLLSKILLEAMEGNATLAYEVYGGSVAALADDEKKDETGLSINEAIYFYRLNDGVSGEKNWPQDNEDMIRTLEPFYIMNPFMYVVNSFYWAKAKWTIPRTHPYVPEIGVKTAHPLLAMSTTWDPVTSLEGAKTTLKGFQDSRLVIVDAYGHGTYSTSNDCANTYLRNYLLNGSLPESQVTTCEFDSAKYFPPIKHE